MLACFVCITGSVVAVVSVVTVLWFVGNKFGGAITFTLSLSEPKLFDTVSQSDTGAVGGVVWLRRPRGTYTARSGLRWRCLNGPILLMLFQEATTILQYLWLLEWFSVGNISTAQADELLAVLFSLQTELWQTSWRNAEKMEENHPNVNLNNHQMEIRLILSRKHLFRFVCLCCALICANKWIYWSVNRLLNTLISISLDISSPEYRFQIERVKFQQTRWSVYLFQLFFVAFSEWINDWNSIRIHTITNSDNNQTRLVLCVMWRPSNIRENYVNIHLCNVNEDMDFYWKYSTEIFVRTTVFFSVNVNVCRESKLRSRNRRNILSRMPFRSRAFHWIIIKFFLVEVKIKKQYTKPRHFSRLTFVILCE